MTNGVAIYTAKASGASRVQITYDANEGNGYPAWGTHPAAASP